MTDLAALFVVIAAGDHPAVSAALDAEPSLVTARLARDADVRARDRRGAEPLHAATSGEPGGANWHPARQQAVIEYLIDAGADPNATAAGGVTPLHRAVRDRCSAAVAALLRAGADPHLANDNGSTAADLVRWTTGRGGTGSEAAKAEQQVIAHLLGSRAK
jgi:ankyrin repeat protein